MIRASLALTLALASLAQAQTPPTPNPVEVAVSTLIQRSHLHAEAARKVALIGGNLQQVFGPQPPPEAAQLLGGLAELTGQLARQSEVERTLAQQIAQTGTLPAPTPPDPAQVAGAVQGHEARIQLLSVATQVCGQVAQAAAGAGDAQRAQQFAGLVQVGQSVIGLAQQELQEAVQLLQRLMQTP